MSDTRSAEILMALLASKATDFPVARGAAIEAVGRGAAGMPSLDERIEMFARMVCGTDVIITPEIRALAREQILTAMAADLVEMTTDFTPVIASAPEFEPERPLSLAEQMQESRSRMATQTRSSGWWSTTQEWLSSATRSYSVMRLGMAAVPLMILLVGGSILTENWVRTDQPSLQEPVTAQNPATASSPAPAPKMRGFGPQHVDTAAEQNLQHAITSEEAAHGRATATVARNLADLAGLYRADGRFKEAQALCERALIIDDQVLGPNDPETLRAIKELAAIYRAEGRAKDADQILSRSSQP